SWDNTRYLVRGAALTEIPGAATGGWAGPALGRAAGRFVPPLARAGVGWVSALAVAVLAWLFVPGFVGGSLVDIPKTHGALNYQASLRSDLNQIGAAYGWAPQARARGHDATQG